MSPNTLAEAWATEAKERGATPTTPGYDDAQNLFYSGAAAFLSMIADAGVKHTPSTSGYMAIYNLVQTTMAELREYLEDD
jgi:hypothetical protein